MLKALLPLATGAALMFAVSGAQAMPSADHAPGYSSPEITLVSGGCGPYRHRGPWGGCRPGGQWGYRPGWHRPGWGWRRACPPGFHLGPYGHRCFRNRW